MGKTYIWRKNYDWHIFMFRCGLRWLIHSFKSLSGSTFEPVIGKNCIREMHVSTCVWIHFIKFVQVWSFLIKQVFESFKNCVRMDLTVILIETNKSSFIDFKELGNWIHFLKFKQIHKRRIMVKLSLGCLLKRLEKLGSVLRQTTW